MSRRVSCGGGQVLPIVPDELVVPGPTRQALLLQGLEDRSDLEYIH